MPQNDLTADQIEQLGRLLLPTFQQAIRSELHALRNDLNGTLSRQSAELQERIDALEERVDALERVKLRVLAAWAGVVAAVTLAYHTAKDWIFGSK